MSYSFNVKAADKAAAKEAVAAKFDSDVIANQAVHARDRAAVLANANTVIDLLADDDTKDVSVSCSGSVSWGSAAGDEPLFSSVSIACNASHAVRMLVPGQ